MTDVFPIHRPDAAHLLLRLSAFASLLLSGAIFGFFYAWVCSTMWGLDAAPPEIAVRAMQTMNASVRNAVFAPAFFGTLLALAATAGLTVYNRNRSAALWFGAAAVLYILGGFLVTLGLAVPMNESLAAQGIPASAEEAARLWAEYSSRWQVINRVRTVACAGVLVLTGIGLTRL